MRRNPLLATAVFAVLAAGCAAPGAGDADIADIHGLAVDPSDSRRLFVATHHGLFVGTDDRSWKAVTKEAFDMMGFTVHPTDGRVMYASGHPPRGGNLGFAESTDAGETWTVVALANQVDFHALTVSRADPDRLWGHYAGRIYVSDDRGRTWDNFAPDGSPRSVLALGGGASSRDTLYLAGHGGLYRSQDAGRTWDLVEADTEAFTAVATTPDPLVVYAHSYTRGVLRSLDGGTTWHVRGGKIPPPDTAMSLAVDPQAPDTLYLGGYFASIHKSTDGGATFTRIREGNR
jgi:photosystem II stability/assembly factor-like uncharacterized protein